MLLCLGVAVGASGTPSKVLSSWANHITLSGEGTGRLDVFLEKTCVCPSSDVAVGRAAQLPYAVPRRLVPAPPPDPPSRSSVTSLLVVLHRHGTRRALHSPRKLSRWRSPGSSVGTSQLLPQGAHELHVSGEEVRAYFSQAFKADATCPELTKRLSASYIHIRSSAIARTQWSALCFMEGLYALPPGCLVSEQDLQAERGTDRRGQICVHLALGRPTSSRNSLRPQSRPPPSEYVGVRLPCVYAPDLQEDALVQSASETRGAKEARKRYAHTAPAWVPTEGHMRRALELVPEIFGEGTFGHRWLAGERALAERGALPPGYNHRDAEMNGERVLGELYDWVEEQVTEALASRGEEGVKQGKWKLGWLLPGDAYSETAKTTEVVETVYKKLLELYEDAFRQAFAARHGGPGFAHFASSPFILLVNALMRAKAYGRLRDFENLRRVLHMEGGFESFFEQASQKTVEKERDVAAAQKREIEVLRNRLADLEVMLLSNHDRLLTNFLATLGLFQNQLIPFSAKVYVELTYETSGASQSPESPEARREEAGFVSEDERLSGEVWPDSTYRVRLLYGSPGHAMDVLSVPFCRGQDRAGSGTVCPLHIWLRETYRLIEGHAIHQVASLFKERWQGTPVSTV